MTAPKFILLAVGNLMLLACFTVNQAWARPGETTRVSVASDGTQGWGSRSQSLSADGRWVAFMSWANNLVSGDTNGVFDVFLHDRLTHQTSRVSLASDGTPGNKASGNPSLSADGRWVAFESMASNLVTGDNGSWDVFLHDRLIHKTTLVSLASDGTPGNNVSWKPSLSADGRWVTFTSFARNLVAYDPYTLISDVFLHDRLSHTTTLVSAAPDGTYGHGHSDVSSLSADGRWVAFNSVANNLVAGDSYGTWDVFLYDRLSHTTTRVSVASDGTPGNNSSRSSKLSLSADGRWVAFESYASNLVAGDTNHAQDIFLHDRLTHQTTRVSVASDGKQGNGSSYLPNLSADGRWVAFNSNTSLAGDFKGEGIFLHDRLTHQTSRVSLASDGTKGNNTSRNPSLSADGRWMAFTSSASNLVAGDTNNSPDIFVRDRSLVTGFQGDLTVTATQKPASLNVGGTGSYVFNIANNGPDAIEMARLTHLISNGNIKALTPSQGECSRYSSVTLCEFGPLSPGQSLTLTVSVKAIRNSISQKLSVSSGGKADPAPANNYLTVATPVTP